MRTSKRYTNTTFTRRVDHEAGMHRPARARKGHQVCDQCGALYARRRWTRGDPATLRLLETLGTPIHTTCPACRMAAEGQFGGEIRVSGQYVPAHRSAIERLLRNEAARAAEDNPLARILSLDRTAADRLTVRTTTEHLAKRLGEALHKAFHGRVHYGFSHENKFAHVLWSRD
jgi:hypothetical protein